MSGRVLSLAAPVADMTEALEVIDSLRSAVERGEVVAFACVGIEPDDCTRMWSSATRPTTRLKLIGAMAHMLHSYEAVE